MSDNLAQLEEELAAMRPARPSKRVEEGIAAAFSQGTPAAGNGRLRRLWGLAACAAVAILVTALIARMGGYPQEDQEPTRELATMPSTVVDPLDQAETDAVKTAHGLDAPVEPNPLDLIATRFSAPEGFRRVRSANLLLGSRDQGIISLGPHRAARKYELRILDHVSFENPTTSRRVEASQIRDQVVLVGLDVY